MQMENKLIHWGWILTANDEEDYIFLLSLTKSCCIDQPCVANHIYRADMLKVHPVGKQSMWNMAICFMQFKEKQQQVVQNINQIQRILLAVLEKWRQLLNVYQLRKIITWS